jgi:integrase
VYGSAHKNPDRLLLQSLIPLTPEGKQLHVVGHVFPGVKDRPLTTAAAMNLLKELHPDITAHGFRSTFRDWAAETTKHPREVIEAAMAHRLKDKSEAAYQRGDLLTRRAKLMNDWARYCRSTA